MDIQRIPVSKINPAKYNPRKITDSQLKALKRAMEEFGDLSGIVVNMRTGNLIGGHQRLKNFDPAWQICKRPESDNVGTVAAGYIETPWGRWAYREVDWEDAKEKAANLAANKIGGEFDLPKLRDLLADIQASDIDAALTGFDSAEIEKMLKTADEIQHNMAAQKAGATPWDRMNGAGSEGVIFHFGALTCKLPESIYDEFYAQIDDENLAESVAEVLHRALCDS